MLHYGIYIDAGICPTFNPGQLNRRILEEPPEGLSECHPSFAFCCQHSHGAFPGASLCGKDGAFDGGNKFVVFPRFPMADVKLAALQERI